ncbi:SUMF1/EgtB/PvdO family nonheme iron enzyme, partial [candidate division KSB1 bacterium]|nr:SUMF1/EgtB/PvdO family nonheme iron enzyme [candidate division KSB1 bacterium]
KGVFTLDNFLAEGNRLFGGYDVYGLWPTWPTLGLDERNQFDLFSDLPGGLHGLRREMQKAKNDSTHFFICYNPWDESTRTEDHYAALSELIAATDADGVVLDTRGSSSLKFQQAADNVKPGVIMYSEGMAIPKDMPGIVAGRVHDAIYQQPVLNLNKLIKPDFAIFRVLQLSQGRLHRELALSFFNGYGNEINSFAPGRPDWMEAEFLYMGRLARIQRENSLVFTSQNWTPLIDAAVDSIWVNCWPSLEKTLYTIYSLRPEGFAAPIISIAKKPDVHYVDLLAHEEISVDSSSGKSMLPGCIDAFNKVWLGTRREGNAGCLAVLPRLLHTRLIDDSLFVQAETGSEIRLWVGAPSYQNNPATFSSGSHRIKLSDTFDLTEGKFVVQLFEGDELLDENILTLQPGSPRLISKKGRTKPANRAPQGMVEIPAGAYSFTATQSASFIPYPDFSEPRKMKMKRFFIDKYPVTNGEFRKFIQKTSYAPKDTANFLKHWKLESAWQKIENQPVTYVSLEDAEAYANWTGKRLPTQIEWQYAAQGTTGNNWPWGASFDSTRCNNALGYLTSVDEFPTGENQFGVADLVGNVWQLTSDIYENGSYNFIILKGGSYFKPTSSWWYVEGGPQPLHKQQMLLMLSPGFERNATVGFRCVVDGE